MRPPGWRFSARTSVSSGSTPRWPGCTAARQRTLSATRSPRSGPRWTPPGPRPRCSRCSPRAARRWRRSRPARRAAGAQPGQRIFHWFGVNGPDGALCGAGLDRHRSAAPGRPPRRRCGAARSGTGPWCRAARRSPGWRRRTGRCSRTRPSGGGSPGRPWRSSSATGGWSRSTPRTASASSATGGSRCAPAGSSKSGSGCGPGAAATGTTTCARCRSSGTGRSPSGSAPAPTSPASARPRRCGTG